MSGLAVLASHPVQYHAPLYRALSDRLRLQVYYAHRATRGDQAEAGFGVPFEWDVDLLSGYHLTWLRNRAKHPGVHHFFGCHTPSIAREVERGEYDALLVGGWNLRCYWQGVRAARKAHLPVLVRGDSQLVGVARWPKRLAKRLAYPWMLRWFDGFLSPGRRHTEYLSHYGVPPRKIFFVPHCVDNGFFARVTEAARRSGDGLRRDFGIGRDKVVFLFVGKLVPKKRPADLVLALDRLGSADAWGLIVGDGPLRADLEDHVRREATPCSFAGFLNQSEMGRAFAAADVLVLPSDGRETWGLVVNEAMAAGLPVIVSESAGCSPDLVIEGVTGLSYRCGEIMTLARRMATLVASRECRGRLAEGARAHIASYSIGTAVDGTVSALCTLIDRRCEG